MNIHIISVGKIKEKYLKLGIAEFEKRLKPYCTLNFTEVPDEQAPEHLSEKDLLIVKKKEGERILSKIKQEYVIALDIEGKKWSSEELASEMERGIKKVLPTAEVIKVPLADGGEGTVQALVDSMDGEIITHSVTGPLGKQVEAHYGIMPGNIAVMEIAAAAGLHLVPLENRDPLKTTTYGIGELLLHALDQGIRHFIIGLGGSSTNDGGIGMMQALGAEVTDVHGNSVPFGGEGLGQVNHIAVEKMDNRLQECTFRIACDVINPLTGPEGAAFIYGPQKGADAETVAQLDEDMKRFANVIKRDLQTDVLHVQGAGAAGGIGASFVAFLGAKLSRGIDIITEVTNIESYMKDADLVITGEGKMDDQTVFGKTPVGVAMLAKKHHVPVIAITGANKVMTREMYEAGIHAIFPIVNEPLTLQEAMERSEELTERITENVMRLLVRMR